MLEPTDRHGQPARAWSIEELREADALRRGDSRVITRIPTAAERLAGQFARASRWTKALMKEIARLGYHVASDLAETEGPTYSRLYLTEVGRAGITLVLSLTPDGDSVEIERVTFGDQSFTARQATLWLKNRSAR